MCAQDKDLDTLEKFTNTELQKVSCWLATNKLTLNVLKSKVMLTLKNKNKKVTMDIKFNGQKLEQCNSYKYLGVYIDKNLTWKDHIEHICKKNGKSLWLLVPTSTLFAY